MFKQIKFVFYNMYKLHNSYFAIFVYYAYLVYFVYYVYFVYFVYFVLYIYIYICTITLRPPKGDCNSSTLVPLEGWRLQRSFVPHVARAGRQDIPVQGVHCHWPAEAFLC